MSFGLHMSGAFEVAEKLMTWGGIATAILGLVGFFKEKLFN